ncbi:MAG TPA: C1 family peptidase [Gemmatimonadaceae bacterium]
MAKQAVKGSSYTPDPSYPKTTRPDASERRPAERKVDAAKRLNKTLDAVPDRVDIRDWFYQPRLTALPSQVVNCDLVPFILDQGQEGACTGFALAAVIQFLLNARRMASHVSPYMLYRLARHYDEWPGENYEGSSARGAMKGWVRHGVCSLDLWKTSDLKSDRLLQTVESEGRSVTIADLARATPGGAFYRIDHRNVRDMHAALAEVGILYCTLMVHEGWDTPGPDFVDVHYSVEGIVHDRRIPLIARSGRADDGHAIALVGYTREGFIIQNSWGTDWGNEGFAILPYEDFLLHATDVWAAQLGVPVDVDIWSEGKDKADTTQGRQRAATAVPLSEIRPYVIDVGNNGCLSDTGDYFTTEGDIERLLKDSIPRATAGWAKRRVMLYLHGGLNDEGSVARRVVAFRDVLLTNEIYPLLVMWETGAMESIQGILEDIVKPQDGRSGAAADWLSRMRDGLLEARDRTIELTTAKLGGALWGEMKQNAALASERPKHDGAMQVLARHVQEALKAADASGWELHVVAHSAGSIFAAHLLPLLLAAKMRLASVQFMAPAIRVDEFKSLVYPHIVNKSCPMPTMYILSDVGERDDTVGPYGKSLLYLVSNAFEGRRETPLLGMQRFVSQGAGGGAKIADADVAAMFAGKTGGLPRLVVAGAGAGKASTSRSESHGGFDNDKDTLNSVLRRILGGEPQRLFDVRDLQY